MKAYNNFARTVVGRPWAIEETKFEELRAIWELRMAGGKSDWEGPTPEPFAASTYQGSDNGTIAVIPLYGVLMPKVSPMAAMSGATSTQGFRKALGALVADPGVRKIIIDVDSPGGSVFGIDEMAAEIRAAAARKDVIAVANEGLMASAAYYAMSGASEIIASPSSEVGSIGVLAVHYDYSTQNEMQGIKPTLIKAGKYKAEGGQDFPLTEEALNAIQSDVNRYYEMFLTAVAKGRGVGKEAVRNGFGEGRVVGAQEAVRLGMADRVATLDETISRFMTGGRAAKRGARAEVTTTESNAVSWLITEIVNHTDEPVVVSSVFGVEPVDDAARDRDRLAMDLALAEAGAVSR